MLTQLQPSSREGRKLPKRTLLLGAALIVVGQSALMAGSAIAKTTTRTCPDVTVGLYRATEIRVTPTNMKCGVARMDLRLWLKQGLKSLPRKGKRWHAKLVRGTLQVAYGRDPVSIYFVLVKLPAPVSNPKPTPTPKSTPAPTPKSSPRPKPAPMNQAIMITSTKPTGAVVGGTYTVTATGGASGDPVVFSIDPLSTLGACSISGATVSFTGAGTCAIEANQAGNASYNAAPEASQSVTIGKMPQTIMFTSTLSTSSVVGVTYTVAAIASSKLPVSFSIDASSAAGACALNRSTVTFTGAGKCMIDANQIGNAIYSAAPQMQQTETSGLQSQTIMFTSEAPTDARVGGTYAVAATGSSGLAVAFTIDSTSTSGACSLSGFTVSFVAAGTCVIDADQGGDSAYSTAPQVQQTVTIAKQNQTISITSTPPATQTAGGTYAVTATASSGLPVAFTIDSSSAAGACSLSGSTVSFLAAGKCVIDANQVGNGAYDAAAQVQQSMTVSQAKTVVTLTFDDGYEDMITNVLPILQQDELHGTFYIISGDLNDSGNDSPDYMTWSQLQTLYQDGDEIAGHTVLHEALSQVDADEAIQEVCQDRYDLMNPPASSGLAPGSLGPITDMAYPFGNGIASGYADTTSGPGSSTASTTTIESIIKACGYNSARTVVGVDDGTGTPAAVPLTSTDQYDPTTADNAVSVDDPLAMPTTPSIGSADGITTASQVEAWITGAETADRSSNGWLSVTFHDICTITCDSSDGYQMDTTEFQTLMGWIQQQEQEGYIVVKTMAQVVGGPSNPAVQPGTISPANEWTNVPGWTSTGFPRVGMTPSPGVNSAFNDPLNPNTWYDSPGGAPCYELSHFGTNTVPSQTTTGSNSTGPYVPVVASPTAEPDGDTEAGQIQVTSYTNGDAGIVTEQDVGECSPILTSGTTYTLTAHYQSVASVFFDVFIRSDTGNWVYWQDDSATPFHATAADVWGTATWTLPEALPAGYNGISFGLAIQAAGTLTVDDYSLTG